MKLIDMCMLAEEGIKEAITSIVESDKEKANRAIEIETIIDDKEREIETLCNRLIIQQQPIASDLRNISSALKIITDLERVGDQSADIAKLGLSVDFSVTKDLISLAEMARDTAKMLSKSIDAFVKRDVNLAHEVICYDDKIDSDFLDVKKAIIKLIKENSVQSEVLLDYLMVAKYFERIGDHASNIAGWVIYAVTGEHKYERIED